MLILAVTLIGSCIQCIASDEISKLLSQSLTGTVYAKQNGKPLEDALVVLAEYASDDNKYNYHAVASYSYHPVANVVTDSKGEFFFADPQLWEKKRDLELFVWKHSYSWAHYKITEEFYNATNKKPILIYVPPPEQRCPNCPVIVPLSQHVKVFYATDRKPNNAGTLKFLNVSDPQEKMYYGFCDAGIEGPSADDPIKVNKGFVNELQAYASRDELFSEVAKSQPLSLLLFIHGFDNSFDGACAVAAQLAFDTGFRGAVLAFSWPSAHQIGGYGSDERSIVWSNPHFRNFLTALSSSCPLPLHMLAHSMGNRALLSALSASAGTPPHWGKVIFAAPDVDAGDFKKRVSPGINARRLTLYASKRDMALWASKVLFHSGQKRAGDADPEIETMPQLDSVDASLADTGFPYHSYYRDSLSILSDIASLINDDKPPERRGLTDAQTKAQAQYWIVTP